MLVLRLRQAECAMADGRLDEAYRLLEAPGLRNHRKGQRLVARLARRFGDRAGEHLKAHQPRAALADCGCAIELAGPTPALVTIRDEAGSALNRQRAERRRRDEAEHATREELAAGRLTIAEALVGQAEPDRRDHLRQAAVQQRAAAGPWIERARRALKHGDVEQAIDALIQARRWHATAPRLDGLTKRVTRAATDQARRCLSQGQLDAACRWVDHVERLSPHTMGVASLREAIDLAERAADDLRRRRLRSCEAALGRFVSLEPQAVWAKEMLAAAARAAEELERLRVGPLGTHASSSAKSARDGRRTKAGGIKPAVSPASTRKTPVSRTVDGVLTLPDPFLLTVDGIGSYVVFTADHVRVGPISASARPDLPLITDPSTPGVDVHRTDGGYILQCARPVEVAGQPTTRRLLGDRDVVALSHRCRMTLTQPHPASGTALLRFSGARMPRADLRGAVLLDRELLLGPTSPAHVVCGGLAGPVALVVTDDGLAVRGSARGGDIGDALRLNQPVDLGGVTVTVSAFA